MAVTLSLVNRGTVPGDGTGDTPYVAFGKTNDNSTALKAGVDLVLDVAQNRILGRASVGAGNPEHLTAAQVRSILNVEDGAAADQTAAEIEAIVAHNNLQGVSANEHIDWTQDQGATNINPGNYINTSDHTQLSNIGTNTHGQIDTHLALTNEHIDWTSATSALSTTSTVTALNYFGLGISSGDNTASISISGGNGGANGANIYLYGPSHATNANQMYFRTSGITELVFNGTDTFNFQGNAITTTGNITGGNLSGTNTGDQTSIVGITGTKAQFDTAVTDGNFMYVGDAPTSHTHTFASLTSKPTTLSGYGISDTKANFNTALSDGTFMFTGDAPTAHTHTVSQITDLTNGVEALTVSEVNQLENIGTTTITAADWIAVSNLSGTNTGDQTITLTGDVTGSGTGSFATAIANNVIGLPELTHQTAGQIIYYGASGVPALLGIGSANQVLSVSGGLPSWQTISAADNDLDPTPDTDHSVSGFTASMQVGEAVVFGDLLYMKSDGKLWKADADAATTMPGMYMAAATIGANGTGSVLIQGFARDDTWVWTVGGLVYASTTLGGMTQTAPSGTGDQVQVVGVATHADRIDFRPTPMLIELV
jgi:hypothetical protein